MNNMTPRRRRYLVLAMTTIVTLFLLLHFKEIQNRWKGPQVEPGVGGSILQQELDSLEADVPANRISPTSGKFAPGAPKPGVNYTRTIVVPKKKAENTTWLDEEFPNTPKAFYVVDDRRAKLRPPKNKGNEAMVYLSYIIDHFDQLPDISIFIHAHRYAWHNNDLLDADTAMMIKYLSDQRVIREGYMNLRCQWYPGCPGWLHPNAKSFDEEKKEEMLVGKAWKQIFPHDPVPEVLGQTCCSQFAVSRDRIRAIPLQEYIRLRKWLLKTKIRSSMSGRIFEYLWQYLWTGSPLVCPSMHACYCDGYGACFESEETFQEWFKIRYYVRQDEWELLSYTLQESVWEDWVKRGNEKEAELVQRSGEERIRELEQSIDQRWIVLDSWRNVALENGRDPKARARIAGREWREGDGY